MKLPIFFLLGATLCLTACGTPKRGAPVVTPQPLLCDGALPARITLFSPDEASLLLGERRYALKRTETNEGVRYENGDVAFSKNGIDAVISRKDGSVLHCRYIPAPGL
jgi:hypothetical protein